MCFSQWYYCVQCILLSVYRQGRWPWKETEWMSCLINLVFWVNRRIQIQNRLVNTSGSFQERHRSCLEAVLIWARLFSFWKNGGLDQQNNISILAISFKSCFLQTEGMAYPGRRTLHWVFKIGERKETMRFYREVLQSWRDTVAHPC